MKFDSINIEGNTRKLKVSWKPDFLQDLYIRKLITEKYQPIQFSVEEELSNILSSEIAKSIDREIISNIFNLNVI